MSDRLIGNKERTLGKIAEAAMSCPNFFDWEWCQDNCLLYRFCDGISSVQDISNLQTSGLIEKVKEAIGRLGDKLNGG